MHYFNTLAVFIPHVIALSIYISLCARNNARNYMRTYATGKSSIRNSYNMDARVLAYLLHEGAKRPRAINELSARASML